MATPRRRLDNARPWRLGKMRRGRRIHPSVTRRHRYDYSRRLRFSGLIRIPSVAKSQSVNAPAESPIAWEPLTPRGVAAIARARLSRLLLLQFVIASLAAAAAVWFLSNGCFPTVRAAIRNLPVAGEIHAGRLDWAGHAPQFLAERRFL